MGGLLPDGAGIPVGQIVTFLGDKHLNRQDEQKPQQAQHDADFTSSHASRTPSHLFDLKVDRYFGELQL
jgi:hypothetical protein